MNIINLDDIFSGYQNNNTYMIPIIKNALATDDLVLAKYNEIKDELTNTFSTLSQFSEKEIKNIIIEFLLNPYSLNKYMSNFNETPVINTGRIKNLFKELEKEIDKKGVGVACIVLIKE